MKKKYISTLVAATVLLGLGWEMVLQGNTESSRALPRKAAVAPASAARKNVKAVAAEPSPLTCLSGISIRKDDDGKGTTVEISASHPGAYRILHLEKPNRLVVDLQDARNGTHRWKYSSDSPLLACVRLGRFSPKHGGIIRVVADLHGNPVCNVDREVSGFRIELRPGNGGDRSGVSSPVTIATKSSGSGHETKPAAIHKVAETIALPSTRKANKEAEQRPASRRTTEVSLPLNPAQPSAVDLPPAGNPPNPVAKPERQGKKQSSETVHGARAAKAVIAAHKDKASPRHVAVPQTQTAEIGNNPKYTGKRISLNLKGVDLKDFFRLIHEVSGLNIIVDSDVTGTVTVVLDDVPWDQALALVLSNNGLGDRLEGNVLRIARISTLTREEEERKKLEVAREDSAPLVTVFRPLNYAKGATIAALLKTWAGGGALSRRGSVLVDERTNTLIISDIASRMPRIESVVSKLDTKAQQISIQARIIRATSDFVRNLSTTLSFAQRNGSGSLVTGGATGNPVSAQPLSPPTVTTSPATGFGVFVLSNLGRNYAINAAIAAAETRDQAKTISQPSIVTQNNVEGTVIQGTQIPIQTTINNTISVQYVQASLELKVTPQVTQDGNVFLTIDVQNSSPGPALTFAGPTINTQSATTQVLVPNGGTVIFGGVTVHTKSNSSTGVPWIENIPILGHLFKSTATQKNDQELLFFVTPKILTT